MQVGAVHWQCLHARAVDVVLVDVIQMGLVAVEEVPLCGREDCGSL